MQRPPGGLPKEWSALAAGLAQPSDLYIVERQWGPSTAPSSICTTPGVATNFRVESTARQACEHGYAVVIVEDACATMSPELNAMAINSIFPRIAARGDLEFGAG